MIKLLSGWLIKPSHQQDIKNQINQSKWKEFSPSEIHHLIIPKTGDGPTNPNKEKDQEYSLGEKPANSDQSSNPSGGPGIGDPG